MRMAEYIEREAVLEKVSFYDQEMINAIPAADVVPVKRGSFEKVDCFTVGNKRYTAYQCSACGALYPNVDGFQFCANCGARMNAEEREKRIRKTYIDVGSCRGWIIEGGLDKDGDGE